MGFSSSPGIPEFYAAKIKRIPEKGHGQGGY
jgi:hypothetical protein